MGFTDVHFGHIQEYQPRMFIKWPRTVREHVHIAVSVREHVCEIKKNMPITCLCLYQYANNLFVFLFA